jgi:hypothetical protein
MDALAFETQFSRWEALSDIRSALIGNRVAEMYGQSASYGLDLDVYLIRELYEKLRPEAVARAKRAGFSSQQAALRFLCTNVATLGGVDVPTDLARLWVNLATAQVTTERELSRITGLSLATVAAWLWALKEKGVVTVSGTALLEPRYSTTVLSTLSNDAKELRDRLDQTLNDE